MTYHVKVGGVWKTTTANYIKINGTWRTVSSMWIKIAGTWKQIFSSTVARAFTTMSTTYPVTNVSSLFESIGGSAVKACGEGPRINTCYKGNISTSPITWTQGTSYPENKGGPFSSVLNSRIYGVAGGPGTITNYSTTTAATSWTTEANLAVASYWHSTHVYSNKTGIMKVCGFNNNVSTFNGTSWTTRTTYPISGAFNTSTEVNGRSYLMGSSSSETDSVGVYSTIDASSYTTETSMPVATRRTYCSNIDNKPTLLGGTNLSTIYTYSGTGGTWTAGISSPYGATNTSTTENNAICYGTAGTTVWRYA